MLSAGDENLYDVGHDPRLAGALVTPSEAASITAIARELRAAIYAGTYPVGTQLPTRVRLAKDRGVSAESAGAVMRMLASERLISLEQGRGTFVLPRRRWHAEVSVRWTKGAAIPAKVSSKVAGALADAEQADPAISDVDLTGSSDLLTVAMDVETGGLSQAVSRAVAVTRKVLSGDGWDLDGASVEARPVDGE